eukprot:sb/3476674/
MEKRLNGTYYTRMLRTALNKNQYQLRMTNGTLYGIGGLPILSTKITDYNKQATKLVRYILCIVFARLSKGPIPTIAWRSIKIVLVQARTYDLACGRRVSDHYTTMPLGKLIVRAK